MNKTNSPYNMVVVACLLLCSLSGCQVGRTWFQVHSDNPTPALGIDLVPKRADRDESRSIRTISATAEDAMEPAANPVEQPEQDARWPKWWKGFGKPKRIPLPRTDLPQESEGRFESADRDDFVDGGF